VKDREAKVMNIGDHHQEEDSKSSVLLLIHTGLPTLAILLMAILQEEDLSSTCASPYQRRDSQSSPLAIHQTIQGFYILIDQGVGRFMSQTSMREITSYLVVKKMNLRKTRELGSLKARFQVEVINSKAKL